MANLRKWRGAGPLWAFQSRPQFSGLPPPKWGRALRRLTVPLVLFRATEAKPIKHGIRHPRTREGCQRWTVSRHIPRLIVCRVPLRFPALGCTVSGLMKSEASCCDLLSRRRTRCRIKYSVYQCRRDIGNSRNFLTKAGITKKTHYHAQLDRDSENIMVVGVHTKHI